jgi:hypothetical protein
MRSNGLKLVLTKLTLITLISSSDFFCGNVVILHLHTEGTATSGTDFNFKTLEISTGGVNTLLVTAWLPASVFDVLR